MVIAGISILLNVVIAYNTGSKRRNLVACSAILNDGSAFCWGISKSCSNYPAVSMLQGMRIINIYFTAGAFAGLLNNGTVSSWGESKGGTGAPAAIALTSGVVDVISTDYPFVLLLENGKVYAFGDSA